MRIPYLIFSLIFLSITLSAQLPLSQEEFFSRLAKGNTFPENLVSTRSVVFYPVRSTQKELELIQKYFQESGIDAVAYFDADHLTAGRDLSMATAGYLNNREIGNLVIIQKFSDRYTMTITAYNRKANFVEEGQPCWYAEDRLLEEILKSLNRATSSLKRGNLLINDYPETGIRINPISGRRNEFFAVDLKVDMLAVPKFGNEAMDQQLEEIMKAYPFKFTFTDPNTSEADLRKQGMLFVLRFVHAGAKLAKKSLGYDVKESESAVVSITYPDNEPIVKNIQADAEVFKFYFKHIESGNIYLGTKWDADLTWQEALQNQIKAFKKELKIN